MRALRIHVENGRITGDAPSGLPDGDFELSLVDASEEMPDEEFARLESALANGLESARAGRARGASEFASELLRLR